MRQLKIVLSEYRIEPVLTHFVMFLLAYSVIYIVLLLLQESVAACVETTRERCIEEGDTTIEPLLPLPEPSKRTAWNR